MGREVATLFVVVVSVAVVVIAIDGVYFDHDYGNDYDNDNDSSLHVELGPPENVNGGTACQLILSLETTRFLPISRNCGMAVTNSLTLLIVSL